MPVETLERPETQAQPVETKPGSKRRSKNLGFTSQSSITTLAGVMMAVIVLLVSAGATIFFLTKQPDDERLFVKGSKELANGQYAFAVHTLEQAAGLRQNDPRVYLALARAYVGIDQVDKAWDAISHAQQLGSGVVADPKLASDLANYYRQRGKYEKALDLLRPLAKENVPGKKAELADLDALWGDEALRNGNLDLALRLWEEVRDLREGARFGESEARLATIYQKMAVNFAAKNEDEKALSYLGKLNSIAQNAKNYEMAADLYERRGQLDLAIDQLRHAIKFSSQNSVYQRKLALLLNKRGKELLDRGDTDAGYGYLQQSRSIDPSNALPTVTLRDVTVGLDSSSRLPRLQGELWNAGDDPVNTLNVKVDLVDIVSKRVLWTRDQRIVDEFVSPMSPQDTRNIDFVAGAPVRMNGTAEFKVYIQGKLYNSYTLGEKPKPGSDSQSSETATTDVEPARSPSPRQAPALNRLRPSAASQTPAYETPSATEVAPPAVPPAVAPVAPRVRESSEEKTMKDLDL